MKQVTFVRDSQQHGRFRPYPTEAYQFWHDHGWIVGEVLRPEMGMTFAELVQACAELFAEQPDMDPTLIEERYLAWCLVRLLELGMAAIEPLDDTGQSSF